MLRFLALVALLATPCSAVAKPHGRTTPPPDSEPLDRRLVRFGGMPAHRATALADVLRSLLTPPFGATTDPLELLDYTYAALPGPILVNQCMIAFGLGWRRQVGLRVQECDALAAAILRKRAAVPWHEADHGEWLYGELLAAGNEEPQAKSAAAAMVAAIEYIPMLIDRDGTKGSWWPIFRSCPASAGLDFGQRWRTWQAGVTRPLALCVARALGTVDDERIESLIFLQPADIRTLVAWQQYVASR